MSPPRCSIVCSIILGLVSFWQRMVSILGSIYEMFSHNVVKGHFTHETESPSPLHFKHSHWWKRRSSSKFVSHYAWGTNRVHECKMDVKSTWITTWHWMDHVSWSLDYSQKPPLGGRSNTKPGDPGTSNAHNCWFVLFYHVWRPAWV